MKRFFTSDLHLGSMLINKYANRPYNSAQNAVDVLTANINTTLKKTDVLIHVGDFMLAGVDRHDKIEDHGLSYKLDDYLSMLQPNVTLLAGNHDDGHNSETVAKSMVVDLNQNYKHVYVSHYPSMHAYYKGPDCSKWKFGRGIVLCGHVHDKWLLFYDKQKNVLNINVGVDVWNYYPVEDTELTELLDFIKSAKVKMPKTSLTPADLLKWHNENEAALKRGREDRKAERYKKKGLTPEECQRRKEAAMKKKGLDPKFKKQKAKSREDAFTHEDAVQFGIVPPDTLESNTEI